MNLVVLGSDLDWTEMKESPMGIESDAKEKNDREVRKAPPIPNCKQ